MQSQLSLSIELTRVIPAAGLLAQQSLAAVVKMSKLLRLSGSDIAIEEDLAAILSKVRLEPKFESSFKESIQSATTINQISNTLQIYLQSGAGVTVQRALREPYYLPMVVQLSLLCHVHDLDSLADGLSEALVRRAMESDESDIPPQTPVTALRGVLEAVAEQTSGFNWSNLFADVAEKLAIPKYQPGQTYRGISSINIAREYETLPVHVLQGALDMMAAVQRLYKDRIMVVDGWRGAITMVVWAHHVLGLTVRVNGDPVPNSGWTFEGKGDVSVIINLLKDNEDKDSLEVSPSTYLMNASDGFKVVLIPQTEDSMSSISPERKLPIEGYVPNIFRDDESLMSEISVTEMSYYSSALALVLASNQYDLLSIFHNSAWKELERRAVVFDKRKIRDASRLLLGDIYDQKRIEGFAKDLTGAPIRDMIPPPSLSYPVEPRSEEWVRIRTRAVDLARIILAFSAVGDVSCCSGMLLRDLGDIDRHPTYIFHNTRDWGGHDQLLVKESEWFSIITSLMCGRGREVPSGATLWSGWGWSVYFDCLAGVEPFNVRPGRIWIQRGVPYHNGQTAHSIIDGKVNLSYSLPKLTKRKEFGAVLQLECVPMVAPARHMVAFRNDSFIVTLRFNVKGAPGSLTMGYGTLGSGRWRAETLETSCCGHEAMTEPITLGLGIVATEGFLFDKADRDERIWISMVYGNKDARWVALASAFVLDQYTSRRLVLRGENTCVSCFIKESCRLEGDLWLII